jgi:[CysO sulfur-carrier protein]-S-L-cysteine hydrolase
VNIATELLDEVIAHARRDAPNECCGIVATRDGDAVSAHELENLQASPLRFEIDGLKLFELMTELEDAGLELGAIYHSHTRSAPYPSQTDINFAGAWPGVEWLIVGLADDEPEVRSYLIDDNRQVTEVALADVG